MGGSRVRRPQVFISKPIGREKLFQMREKSEAIQRPGPARPTAIGNSRHLQVGTRRHGRGGRLPLGGYAGSFLIVAGFRPSRQQASPVYGSPVSFSTYCSAATTRKQRQRGTMILFPFRLSCLTDHKVVFQRGKLCLPQRRRRKFRRIATWQCVLKLLIVIFWRGRLFLVTLAFKLSVPRWLSAIALLEQFVNLHKLVSGRRFSDNKDNGDNRGRGFLRAFLHM